MSKFNLEDYRHPWETGPHWELKKEFMEKYSDMFPEDRLLCLAQAYSNIVLMNCSYPDPVMRQISLLSKPLQMRKRFQEVKASETEESRNQQQKGKRKYADENSGKSCKLIKFCASEEQLTSDISSSSMSLDENALKQSSHGQTDSSSIGASDNLQNSPQQFEYNANFTVKDQNQITTVNSNTQIEEKVSNSAIVATLGLEFIQNFLQEVRHFQTKPLSASESILSAAQRLKICSQINFKVDHVPSCPISAPEFCSEFSINGCVISSELGSSKKKAKAKCAETALDVLIKLAGKNRAESNRNKIPTVNFFPTSDSFVDKQSTKEQCMNTKSSQLNHPKKLSTSDAVTADMRVLQIFSYNIIRTKHESLEELMYIAKSLNLHNYISFDTIAHSKSLQETEYICKFYIKNILISSGKDADIKTAKTVAVKSGFQKLKEFPQYEIADGELKQRQNANIDNPSNLVSSHYRKEENCDFESSSFIVNQTMFDASVRHGFVLLDNLSLQNITQRNARAMLSSSASFCHKSFEYKFEDVPGINPPSKKASVVIGEEIVATAISSSRDQAKIIACDKALESLKKKYYTLKVKSEYNDGYIITRSQVFDGESFSSSALTENNIGCKMLKSMGWTGGGLGTSGIAEPVEAQGQNSFGSGLGYRKGKNDLQLFKRRINSMLQDYSRTDTLSDLVFSKEFAKDERKEIHRIAQKYGLHTVSYGANEDRFLTVRHKYTVTQILLYLAKNGGSNSKFELVDASDMTYEM